ncbi:hypothetical protein J4233_02565 [Candidatus Pacearchaeota archaeon]|nr:hypothetical protein [Candidatus Pacearchaeota archaeon]
MKKKMKIRELKSKIKIIREIRGGAEGDKEIEGLTEGELPFSESEVDRAAGIINLPSNSGGSGRGGQVVDRPSEQPPRGEEAEEMTGVQLYDTGRSMNGEAGRMQYKPVETIGSGSNLRAAEVGRDFAMGQKVSDYPEATRIESNLRAEDEKKYSTGMESAGGKGKAKRYGWET